MKSTAVLAVSGRLAQASRPPEELGSLLMAEPQQTMERHHDAKQLSELQVRAEATDDTNSSDSQQLSELAAQLFAEAEATCAPNVGAPLAELSAGSLLHATAAMAISSRAALVYQHVADGFTGLPGSIQNQIFDWAFKQAKDDMRESLGLMVAQKQLEKALTAVRTLSKSDAKDLLPNLLKVTNGVASATGEYKKLSFDPPLIVGAGSGEMNGFRLPPGNFTAESYGKIVGAYRNNLKEVEKQEKKWFSKELPGTKFSTRYAKACLEDGIFRKKHVRAILGVVLDGKAMLSKQWGLKMYGRAAQHGLDVLLKKAPKDKNEDPWAVLAKTAGELQELQKPGDAVNKKKIDELIKKIPSALGWTLSQATVKEGLEQLLEKVAEHMVKDSNKVTVKQVHDNGGESLVETPTDLTLAPDQMRMWSCHTSTIASAALLQRTPTPNHQKGICQCCNAGCMNQCCQEVIRAILGGH